MEKTNFYSMVVKGNDLIISRYNLSLAEQRLILKVVSMIKKDDEDFKDYYVSISDYLDLIGSDSNNYYQVKKFTEELLKKPLHIPLQGDNFLTCNWFSSIVYLSEKGVMVCRFDPYLKPYLLQLKNRFTLYRLENVLKLKSKYSIRLYEILKRYENIRETTISLDNFKQYLAIPNTYLYGDIKKRILKPAQEEFKKYTDITFYFEDVKEIRKKVTAIKFIIYSNVNVNTNDADEIDITDKVSDNQLQLPISNQQIQSEEVNKEIKELVFLLPESERTRNAQNILSKYLKAYKFEYIAKQIEYINNQNPKNYFAYLTRAIENDYANSEKADLEKKRIQEAIERELKNAQEEAEHDVSVRIDNERVKIYQEYMNLLNKDEKQSILKEYLQKAKEKYPDLDEKSFSMEFKIQQLITEDIIAKNEIYQKRLSKVEEQAKEKAQKELERVKYTILVKYGQGSPNGSR